MMHGEVLKGNDIFSIKSLAGSIVRLSLYSSKILCYIFQIVTGVRSPRPT